MKCFERSSQLDMFAASKFFPMREEYPRLLTSWTLLRDFAEAFRMFVEEKDDSRQEMVGRECIVFDSGSLRSTFLIFYTLTGWSALEFNPA
jgi:hypothetical protein